MTVLIVDDDHEVREVIAETLEDIGYNVVQASSGEEALPALEANPEISVVITDVRMPGMSGLDLVTRIEKADSSVRCILISGFFLPQPVQQRFLMKPFHVQELALAVQAEVGAYMR